MQRRVILAVLDRAERRAEIVDALAASPDAVVFAADGAEGFDRFVETRPDVCLVCENASRIRGSVLCRLIRDHHQSQGVGIVLLAEDPEGVETQTRAAEAGVDAVLALPVDAQVLGKLLARPFAYAMKEPELAPEPVPVPVPDSDQPSEGDTNPFVDCITASISSPFHAAFDLAPGEDTDRELLETMQTPSPWQATPTDLHDTLPPVGEVDDAAVTAVFASDASPGSATQPPDSQFIESLRQEIDRRIQPLEPEERGEESLRRALEESPLGTRLTKRILALHRLLGVIDYFQLLGVSREAGVEEVRTAYGALALEYHPDRFFACPAGPIKQRVRELFMRINEAYTVLMSAELRSRYLGQLEAGVAGANRLPLTKQPSESDLQAEAEAEAEERSSEATTDVGKKFLRLAMQALTRGDLDAAHLNLTFALGHEPDNRLLARRLDELERRMTRHP